MWRNILRNTLFGLVVLTITSIVIKNFSLAIITTELNI